MLQELARSLKLCQGLPDRGVLRVPFQVDKEMILPGFLPGRARLDTGQVNVVAREGGQHPVKGPHFIPDRENDGGLVLGAGGSPLSPQNKKKQSLFFHSMISFTFTLQFSREFARELWFRAPSTTSGERALYPPYISNARRGAGI